MLAAAKDTKKCVVGDVFVPHDSRIYGNDGKIIMFVRDDGLAKMIADGEFSGDLYHPIVTCNDSECDVPVSSLNKHKAKYGDTLTMIGCERDHKSPSSLGELRDYFDIDVSKYIGK